MIDAGFAMAFWAQRPETLTTIVNTPARASSTAALLAEVEHRGIGVVDNAGGRQVCSAVFPTWQGERIAVHSTGYPQMCRSVAQDAAACGIAPIGTAVCGGSTLACAP